VHACACMRVRACVCVHACACMRVRACVCVHACACMRVRVRACVCVHACACMRERACVCVHACACMRVRVYVSYASVYTRHVHACAYTCARTHARRASLTTDRPTLTQSASYKSVGGHTHTHLPYRLALNPPFRGCKIILRSRGQTRVASIPPAAKIDWGWWGW